MKNPLVMFSSGLDSSMILYDMIFNKGITPTAFICDYDQTSKGELDKAIKVCEKYNVPYIYQKFELLDSDNLGVIHVRNLSFLTKALEHCCHKGFDTILMGSVANDTAIDSSQEFVDQFNEVSQLFGVKVEAPIKKMYKHEILRKILEMNIDWNLIHSCRNNEVCFNCKTCDQLLDAFDKLGYSIDLAKAIVLGQGKNVG